MSKKDNIEKYLEPEYPVLTNDESTYGFTYSYIGPDKTGDGADPLFVNCPVIGDLWDESATDRAVNKPAGIELRVRSVSFTPRLGNSDYSRLVVSTEQPRSVDSGTIGNAPAKVIENETTWTITTRTAIKPLILHPAFLPAGASDLSVSAGSPSRTGYSDVYGWELMPESDKKRAYQYYKINDDGTQSGTLMTIPANTGSLAYCKLRNAGAESFEAFYLVLTKSSLYRGKNMPPVNEIGRYLGDNVKPPSASFVPDGLKWVKTGDSSRKQGRSLIWQRDEEWTGAQYILYDAYKLNPANIPLG